MLDIKLNKYILLFKLECILFLSVKYYTHFCDVIMSEIHFNEKPDVTEILQSSGCSV